MRKLAIYILAFIPFLCGGQSKLSPEKLFYEITQKSSELNFSSLQNRINTFHILCEDNNASKLCENQNIVDYIELTQWPKNINESLLKLKCQYYTARYGKNDKYYTQVNTLKESIQAEINIENLIENLIHYGDKELLLSLKRIARDSTYYGTIDSLTKSIKVTKIDTSYSKNEIVLDVFISGITHNNALDLEEINGEVSYTIISKNKDRIRIRIAPNTSYNFVLKHRKYKWKQCDLNINSIFNKEQKVEEKSFTKGPITTMLLIILASILLLYLTTNTGRSNNTNAHLPSIDKSNKSYDGKAKIKNDMADNITLLDRKNSTLVLTENLKDKISNKLHKSINLSDYWKDSTVKNCYLTKDFVFELNSFLFQTNKDKIAIAELGGFILGKIETNEDSYDISLEKFVGIEASKQNLYEIEFGEMAWIKLFNLMEKEAYSKLQLVGWFHTHPGHGVFLSEQDLFICHNFFNKPYHVAVELDPISNPSKMDVGFFTQRNSGKVNNTNESLQPFISWQEILN